MSANPIGELKKVVGKPGSSFTNKLESSHRRLTVIASKRPEKLDVFYKDDKINLFGNVRFVRRLYIKSDDDCEFEGVGWIINEDINFCMICARQFGLFLYRHHCRCCGNLVCDSCSPDTAVIFEMQDSGEQRVCVQCFWGQDPVYASIHGANDEDGPNDDNGPEDEDDDEDDDEDEDDDHVLHVKLSEMKEEMPKALIRSKSDDTNDAQYIDSGDDNTVDTTTWREKSLDQSAEDDGETSRRLRALAVQEAERLREQVSFVFLYFKPCYFTSEWINLPTL